MYSNLWRESSEEKRELQRLQEDMINDLRQCAEVHRQVRAYMRKIVQPGIKLIDMCETLEDSVRNLIDARGLEAGIAFPTGCSLDWVAAHWTPNSGDKTVLTYDSVMKLGALQLSKANYNARITASVTLQITALTLQEAVHEATGSHEVKFRGEMYQKKKSSASAASTGL